MRPRFIVLALVLSGVWSCSDPPNGQETFDWDELVAELQPPASERQFQARDQASLGYRVYGDPVSVELILLHGSGYHSAYFSRLASEIANSGSARVWTPDIRGHGSRPQRRGDIDYIDQLEDDLVDFSAWVRSINPTATLLIGGHSAGGGLAIRFAGGSHSDTVDGYVLLAPFLQYNAPTVRSQLSGWASPKTNRIVALNLLNTLGVRSLNGMTTLEFSIPPMLRTGEETPTYSYRLMTGINPRNYASDLQALKKPALVLVGTEDEVFYAEKFVAVFEAFAPHTHVELIPETTHLGLVVDTRSSQFIVEWLERLKI